MHACLIRVLLVGAIAGLNGCATMFSGSLQQLQVTADDENPVKLEVQLGEHEPVQTSTPVSISLEHPNIRFLRFRVVDDCYESAEYGSHYFRRSVDLMSLANLLNYGIGALVDLSTGYFWDYQRMIHIPAHRIDNCQKLSTKAVKQSVVLLGEQYNHRRSQLGLAMSVSHESGLPEMGVSGGGFALFYQVQSSPKLSWHVEYNGHFLNRTQYGDGYTIDNNYSTVSLLTSIRTPVVDKKPFFVGIGVAYVHSSVFSYQWDNFFSTSTTQYKNLNYTAERYPLFVEAGINKHLSSNWGVYMNLRMDLNDMRVLSQGEHISGTNDGFTEEEKAERISKMLRRLNTSAGQLGIYYRF